MDDLSGLISRYRVFPITLITLDNLRLVDPVANPYSMGAGNPPPALTGREDQETQFRTLLGRLRRGRSSIV